jgi:hypothetical protein
MTTRVTRSEKLLDRLVQAEKLTQKGRDWLIAALDPMHDTQLPNLAGWPDIEDQASVVRCYKQSVTVSCPNAISGNWDLVMQTYPVLNEKNTFVTGSRYNNAITSFSSDSVPIGALRYSIYDPGSQWDLATTASDAAGYGVIPLPDLVASGNGRLLGMGFEVTNTTAEIYRQGTAYVWRTPQQQNGDGLWGVRRAVDIVTPDPESMIRRSFPQGESMFGALSPDVTTTTIVIMDGMLGTQVQWTPPQAQSIMLLPGSRSWEAAKGCYCVVPFISAENPVVPPDYKQPIIVDVFDSNLAAPNNTTDIAAVPPSTVTVAGAALYGIYNPVKWAPVHSSGAAFLGLSNQSTMTITVNMYYEYFPQSSDVSLVTLAKPSAAYDPVALELYSIALSQMPVGVEASMNGLGDWFAGIVSTYAPAIGAALTPIFGPGALAIGSAAKGIADSYLTSQSPQNAPHLVPRARARNKPNSQPPALPPRGKQYYEMNPAAKKKRKRQRKKANAASRQMVVYRP